MSITHLGFYRELPYGEPEGGSIRDAEPLDPSRKVRVVAYLRDAPVLAASGKLVTDFFSGDPLGTFDLHTDGHWIWYSDLAHYVEHHDSALPDDFAAVAAQSSPPDLSTDELMAIAQEIREG